MYQKSVQSTLIPEFLYAAQQFESGEVGSGVKFQSICNDSEKCNQRTKVGSKNFCIP